MQNDNPQYTEEELNALPQTSAVFDKPKLVVNEHEWVQRGYMIEDVCNPSKATCEHVGIPIPFGRLLIKTKGGYDLVDEVTRKK